MRHRKIRRFRYRSNGRGHHSRNNGVDQNRLRSNSFSDMRERNSLKPQGNPESLLEKYNLLAKEALSSGDKILSENYFQHADHFLRISNDKDRNSTKNINDEQRPNNNIETSEKNEATEQNQDGKNII